MRKMLSAAIVLALLSIGLFVIRTAAGFCSKWRAYTSTSERERRGGDARQWTGCADLQTVV